MNYTYNTRRRGIEVEVTERVLYIEYFNRVVHSVTTADGPDYTGASYYDFDPYEGDPTNMMYYESGGGGHGWKIEINAVSPNCQLWIDPEFKDKFSLVLVNVELLAEPVMLNESTANPFEFSRQVGDISYCQKCELHYDEDYCPKHNCEFTEGAEEEWESRKAYYQDDDE